MLPWPPLPGWAPPAVPPEEALQAAPRLRDNRAIDQRPRFEEKESIDRAFCKIFPASEAVGSHPVQGGFSVIPGDEVSIAPSDLAPRASSAFQRAARVVTVATNEAPLCSEQSFRAENSNCVA